MSVEPKAKKLSFTESLDILIKKRNGGAVNFRGIHYQVLYSCQLILKNLWNNASNESITLEGLEDLDHNFKINAAEFIQLKSSENKVNAGDFWAMGVLQNFLQIYLADSNSRFKLVYNFKTADGALKHLLEKKLTSEAFAHWKYKLNNYSTVPFSIKDFLERINFEKITVFEITDSITQLLFQHWNINAGTEMQYLNALAYSVLEWSKTRATITNYNVVTLFDEINHSFSKAVRNEAVKNNWIEAVNYAGETTDDLLAYFDGKAARPYHIAAGIPAERKFWEKKIIDSLTAHDVALIRSSSGQGKSTLAWRTGYQLSERHSIYQLHSSKNWEQINSSLEFLLSRIAIGEFPIVVIDGLDADVEKWYMLVQRTALLPVKYIITSRNEDWSRYGADVSTITLASIDINMSKDEAQEIFTQLKTRGKLHPEIQDWQSVWEQVLEKGLLIEYTYLLTRGEMINARLTKQLQKLKDDRAPAAKAEILRIVSASDCLHIRIETQKLISYITATVTFAGQDRGEVLHELQNEYFINFEGHKIEGLHPVRSINLLVLLHQTIPLSETFINLYQLIEPQDKQDFFRHIMLQLDKQQRAIFYKGISKILALAPYIEMVHALNGISYAEPQKYWMDNKALFDEVFESGGLDLFLIETIPGNPVSAIDGLIKSLPEHLTVNFRRHKEVLSKMPKYTFSQTDLSIMATELLVYINPPNPLKHSYVGLGHLAKWYMKLDLKLTLSFSSEFLSKSLNKLPLDEIKGLFQYVQLSDPLLYEQYVRKDKTEIINYLRKSTNSLSIEEDQDSIVITYFYDQETTDKIVQQAVKRIESVYNLLPFYKKYKTKVIMLPFPSEYVIRVLKSNGEKSLSPENIPDSTEAIYSNIWIDTISRNYEENSAYQWQKSILEIRRMAVEWCISAVKIIEDSFEGNETKRNAEILVFDVLNSELNNSLIPVKAYPKYVTSRIDYTEKLKHENSVNQWLASLRIAIAQFVKLLAPVGKNDQNLASVNLKAVFFKLEKMQEAFHKMENFTAPHFDSHAADKNEKIIYERLYKSLMYTMEHTPIILQMPVRSATVVIEQWYTNFILKEMNDLRKIIDQASSVTGYEFIIPHQLQKTETVSSVVIGIKNFDLSEDNAWLVLAGSLAGFADYHAEFVTVVAVRDGVALGALQFKKYFLTLFRNFDETKAEELLQNQPLPVIPDQEHASILGIKIIEQDPKSPIVIKYQILMEMWKMSRIRSILNPLDQFDREWLNEFEKEIFDQIEKRIMELPDNEEFDTFTDRITSDFKLKQIWSDQATIDELITISLS